MALNFPDTPSIGQIFPNPSVAGVPQWRWDGSEWVPSAQAPAANAISVNVRVFTANGTYSPSPGTSFVEIMCKGAGGSGGGSASATPNGGGGGEGAIAYKFLSSAAAAGQSITIGAGGASVPISTAADGNSGGATSFGTVCVANGGSGGQRGSFGGGAGAGGLPGACDYGFPGIAGLFGADKGAAVAGMYAVGGGRGGGVNGTAGVANSGGGGGCGSTTTASGAGGSGVCIVTEWGYFSGVADPGAVRYDSAQSLSTGQQTQARQNISVDYATKADQQTGTAANKVVTPAHQQDHDGSAKAWVMFTGSATNGAQTINAGYNITSVTRVGTGQYNLVFTTPFASAIYVPIGNQNGTTTDGFAEFTSQAAGSIQADFISKAGVTFDPINGAYLVFFGRQ